MKTYMIKGADKTTGVERSFTTKAPSQDVAESLARADGLMIADTLTQTPNGDNWEKIVPQNPLERDVHKILFWVRFWSIATLILMLWRVLIAI